MFHQVLEDWATEPASMFDTLCAESAARWDADELSWAALAAPTADVVDTSDPTPWLLVETDREGRYPAPTLRELWAELCPASLTAWTRHEAAKLRELLAAHRPPGRHRAPEPPAETVNAVRAAPAARRVAMVVLTGETTAEMVEAAGAAPALIAAAADPVTLGPIGEAPDAAAQDDAGSVSPAAPDGDDRTPTESAWGRFWGSEWPRRIGFGLGAAACAALLATGVTFYWLAWVHG